MRGYTAASVAAEATVHAPGYSGEDVRRNFFGSITPQPGLYTSCIVERNVFAAGGSGSSLPSQKYYQTVMSRNMTAAFSAKMTAAFSAIGDTVPQTT